MKEVLDVTAEDPADNFVFLRDYVDCVNCSKLPEFSPEKLKGGYTPEMRDAAQSKLKINKRQSRRVYEILRLKCANMKNRDEAKAYRLDVKRRLEAPMRRNERDWKKIQRALDDNEYAQKTSPVHAYSRGKVFRKVISSFLNHDKLCALIYFAYSWVIPFPAFNFLYDWLKSVAASCVNEEQKMQQLQQMYEAEVDAYKITIQRMTVHPEI
ncbi:hypothetical protein OESDEN_20293 [Oesophagostomum dentatum]|uniref:Histone acetyltransferase type B catalytic subunit n=1 Tax=Oesophagostomum dentatum TaxID=61180 RepID=A0A0B1S949_OESDE|nr:hypothetical protein OESDEN_20293 [Oesophagostomum dentatum]